MSEKVFNPVLELPDIFICAKNTLEELEAQVNLKIQEGFQAYQPMLYIQPMRKYSKTGE